MTWMTQLLILNKYLVAYLSAGEKYIGELVWNWCMEILRDVVQTSGDTQRKNGGCVAMQKAVWKRGGFHEETRDDERLSRA